MSTDDTTAPEEHSPGAETEAAPVPPTPEELGLELPEDPREAVDTLLTLLGGALGEAAEHRDGYLRALAETDNIRKRSLRDRTTFIEQATERVMHKLLPVLDTFQAGLDSPAETESEQRLLEGLQGTYSQLAEVLASEGLQAIDAEGEPFDPELHEAISVLGEGDQLVVQHQMRRGYRLKERVLRPATVVVGPAPAEEADESA